MPNNNIYELLKKVNKELDRLHNSLFYLRKAYTEYNECVIRACIRQGRMMKEEEKKNLDLKFHAWIHQVGRIAVLQEQRQNLLMKINWSNLNYYE